MKVTPFGEGYTMPYMRDSILFQTEEELPLASTKTVSLNFTDDAPVLTEFSDAKYT